MKCFNFPTFPTPVLTYNRKCFEIYCFVYQFFEVSLLTYLGQMFRNESVSSTVEKRVIPDRSMHSLVLQNWEVFSSVLPQEHEVMHLGVFVLWDFNCRQNKHE